MDVIVFMELTHYDSQITDQGYDLQDLVLLVTFKAEPSTNENAPATIDDVDSTDPNGNPFIMLDPDPDWGFEDDGE